MRIKISLTLCAAVFLILISRPLLFSQEQTTPEQQLTAPEQPAQEAIPEPQVLWLWGEVVSVDANNKQITVKYLDYEADTEKEMNIGVDDKTTYENTKSIEEIKPLDTLSIDYTVTSDGKNIAKNISKEKPESRENLQKETQEGPVEGQLKPEEMPAKKE